MHRSDVIKRAMTSQIHSTRLFAQSFVQMQIKENNKGPRHWRFFFFFFFFFGGGGGGGGGRDPPVTGVFPSQWASNAENVSIWWRHHENGENWFSCPTHGCHWHIYIANDCIIDSDYFWEPGKPCTFASIGTISRRGFYTGCPDDTRLRGPFHIGLLIIILWNVIFAFIITRLYRVTMLHKAGNLSCRGMQT